MSQHIHGLLPPVHQQIHDGRKPYRRWSVSPLMAIITLMGVMVGAGPLFAGDAEQPPAKAERVLVSLGSVIITAGSERETASQILLLSSNGKIKGYTFGYRTLRNPGDDESEPDALPKVEDPALLRNEFDQIVKQIGKEKTWRSMTDIRTWMLSRNIPQVKLYTWGYAPEDNGSEAFYPMFTADDYRDALPIRKLINRWCVLANVGQVEDVDPVTFREERMADRSVDPEQPLSLTISSMDLTAGDMILATTQRCSITTDGMVSSDVFRAETLVKVQAPMTQESLRLVKTSLARLVCTRIIPEGDITKQLQERILKQTRLVFSIEVKGGQGAAMSNDVVDCALSPQDLRLLTVLRTMGPMIQGLPKGKAIDLVPLLQKQDPGVVVPIAYVANHLSGASAAILQKLDNLTEKKPAEVQRLLGKSSETFTEMGLLTREDFVVTDGKDITYLQVLYGSDGNCTGIGLKKRLWAYDPSYPGLVPLSGGIPP